MHVVSRRRVASLSSSSRRPFNCTAIYNPQVQIKEEGQPETLDYRLFFVDRSSQKVSPWHDIPLQVGDGVFNLVVEIPKESSAKMEVATDEPHTPIKQDTIIQRRGNFVTTHARIFFGDRCMHICIIGYNVNWNYRLLPQTREDSTVANAEVEGALGDNDPGMLTYLFFPIFFFLRRWSERIGEILKVKPLAALAMIDEGELDWKIITISLDDPRASLVNDIDDVEKHFPGTLTAVREWFRDLKIPDGKPANKFGLGNKAAKKAVETVETRNTKLPQLDYALKVITETNESWAKLVKRSIPAEDLALA
ncbi:unnamed protein product [Malus baccata var. baccata]